MTDIVTVQFSDKFIDKLTENSSPFTKEELKEKKFVRLGYIKNMSSEYCVVADIETGRIMAGIRNNDVIECASSFLYDRYTKLIGDR